jgi:hypothetical protein
VVRSIKFEGVDGAFFNPNKPRGHRVRRISRPAGLAGPVGPSGLLDLTGRAGRHFVAPSSLDFVQTFV